jgi:hypothetical protein
MEGCSTNILSRYDPARRSGFYLSLKSSAVTTSLADCRQLHFRSDNDQASPWADCGRPGNSLLAFALTVHEGTLYASTCEPPQIGVRLSILSLPRDSREQPMNAKTTVKRTAGVPAEIEVVRRQFEQWRSRRTRGARPIPDRLWDQAVRLSQQYGVSRISKILRVGYYSLKERGATGRTITGAASGVSPNPQPTGDGRSQEVARSAVGSAPGGTQLGIARTRCSTGEAG